MADKRLIILIADDDADDRLLIHEAFNETGIPLDLHFVEDGEELLTYLYQKRPYNHASRPDIILLDLNMPRKDGREALAELKKQPQLKTIPVIAFTTSQATEDIRRMYHLGVNSYITKPTSFDELVDIMQTLSLYWFEIVCLPSNNKS